MSLFATHQHYHKAARNHCCILLRCARLSFGCRCCLRYPWFPKQQSWPNMFWPIRPHPPPGITCVEKQLRWRSTHHSFGGCIPWDVEHHTDLCGHGDVEHFRWWGGRTTGWWMMVKKVFGLRVKGYLERFYCFISVNKNYKSFKSWFVCMIIIHSRKLTWNLKMMVSNRNLLLQVSIFGCHVNWAFSFEFWTPCFGRGFYMALSSGFCCWDGRSIRFMSS